VVGKEQIEREFAATIRRLLDEGAEAAEVIGMFIVSGADAMARIVGHRATAAALRDFADTVERRGTGSEDENQ